jgi:hypothetical protein
VCVPLPTSRVDIIVADLLPDAQAVFTLPYKANDAQEEAEADFAGG